jgi:hypothetical protein
MKSEQDNQPGARGVFSQPGECSLQRLQAPEIVGQMDNPVLEAVRRFSWRAFDRVCDCVVVMRLLIHDRIFGPQPPNTQRRQRRCERSERQAIRDDRLPKLLFRIHDDMSDIRQSPRG